MAKNMLEIVKTTKENRQFKKKRYLVVAFAVLWHIRTCPGIIITLLVELSDDKIFY